MRYLYEFAVTISGWGETEEEAFENAFDAFFDDPGEISEGVLIDQEEEEDDEDE